ncbi:MAG: DNA translocase FtsK [Deltaproteobacteria bacterium]|uniref:DNA translocase FtsK n=1 Tax=Desulforhabdus amnigena TaxID=40218 RepID=A0A9W6FTS8_9BACT|nr:DNA translocase FtsK [Deltaproteobacteria bacterium]GLI34700.1 DNA translocase FtsK [Desulforhabdus amnigena]
MKDRLRFYQVENKKHEIWALCILTITLMVFFSLISFHSSDPTFFNASSMGRSPRNWIGSLGAHISWSLFFFFGLAAYGFTFLGFWFSLCLFRGAPPLPYGRIQYVGIFLLFLSFMSLAALHEPKIHFFGQEILTGGEIGLLLAQFLAARLNFVGTHILLVGVFLIALLLSTPLTIESSLDWICRQISLCGKGAFSGAIQFFQKIRNLRPEPPELVPVAASRPRRVKKPSSPMVEALPAPESVQQPPAVPIPEAKKITRNAAPIKPPPAASGQYALPPLDLLDAYEATSRKPDMKKLEDNAAILQEKLADFGVQGKVMEICPGPVITMYEYAPAPGIKISRIVGLSDDLSMALKAVSIRVVAPIPGKAAIGIEIPNEHRELVSIRTVIESEAFSGSTAPLTIALGKDITGQPVVANLAKMPHLLIAGATGTGKSVCINAVLSSLLFRNTPDDMRLLLIDPKRIELSSYEGIPQLVHPVVTEPKMATRALRWAVQEMELRYKLLADKNVRNIEGYNRALAREETTSTNTAPTPLEESGLQHHRLPYIVIIIDELADLMMVASREVEESITRLAQMARACGIHLILATQRPSVDVLTGIIKANIPTRISFQVSSRIDSRTIIDGSGAESLLGSGDMLFLPPGTAKLQRIHGAFISDAEVQHLTEFWRVQQLADDPLRERVNFQEISSSEGIQEEELDEKYEEAIELVLETRQASISMLQRRLRVGYNRAARMIEMMEQQGIVGASDGVKPREVLGRGAS